ncbi:MAG: PilZ domain-containing protein [Rhodospirillaceae bacterium]|nr:PilZ domain-containing protein [Rhodospirillaceae bacterium]
MSNPADLKAAPTAGGKAKLRVAGQSLAGRVVSVTIGSVVVRLDEAPQPLAVGTRASLADGPSAGTLQGEVAWCAGRTVGLALTLPANEHTGFLTRETLKLKDPRERRRFPRCAVLMSGTVRALGIEVQCVVQNISLGGVRLRTMDTLAHEGTAILNIPRFGDFDSEVAWQSRDAMGLRFHQTAQQVAGAIGDALPRVIPPSFEDSADAF